MISLMMWYFERDLDEKGREEFRATLDRDLDWKRPTRPQRHLKVVDAPEEGSDSKGKWRAPEGWTPPGWSEEKSYAVAKSFMGWQQNPK